VSPHASRYDRSQKARVRTDRAALAALSLAGALACGSAPAAPQVDAPTAQSCGEASRGELSVVSYNVHGLAAWIAGDDPAARMPHIGPRLAAYDVALVQEDFRYHDELRADIPHATVVRGNPSRFAVARWTGIMDNSGLTAFAGAPRACVQEIVRSGYDACAGWLRFANDCLASKGVLGLRIRADRAHSVDVYTTHLDAGRAPQDRATRRTQLQLLAEHIERSSAGRAVILAGDLNLDEADPDDRALLEGFVRRLGLDDTGASRQDAERWPARIDYILYRSGADTRLEPIEVGEALEFVRDGAPLSDHPALYARFTLR